MRSPIDKLPGIRRLQNDPRPVNFTDTEKMDALRGRFHGETVVVADAGYGRPGTFFWNTYAKNGNYPPVSNPRWDLVDPLIFMYSLRQTTSQGAGATTSPIQIDAITANVAPEGFFGIRKRDIRAKNAIYRIDGSVAWKLNADTSKCSLTFQYNNGSGWANIAGLNVNRDNNFISSGKFVANTYYATEFQLDVYLNANQNSEGAGPLASYSRFKSQIWSNPAQSGGGSWQDGLIRENSTLTLDPANDASFKLIAVWNEVGANNYMGLNWINLKRIG